MCEWFFLFIFGERKSCVWTVNSNSGKSDYIFVCRVCVYDVNVYTGQKRKKHNNNKMCCGSWAEQRTNTQACTRIHTLNTQQRIPIQSRAFRTNTTQLLRWQHTDREPSSATQRSIVPAEKEEEVKRIDHDLQLFLWLFVAICGYFSRFDCAFSMQKYVYIGDSSSAAGSLRRIYGHRCECDCVWVRAQ